MTTNPENVNEFPTIEELSEEEIAALKEIDEPQEEDPSPLVELTREEVKKHQKKDKEKNLLKKEIYNIMVRALTGQFLPRSDWPELETKFSVMQNSDKTVRFVEIDQRGVVKLISVDGVKNAALGYLKSNKKHGYMHLKRNDLAEIASLLQATVTPIKESDISPVLQKSTKGLCWHRLEWDLADGETPLFDELCSRTSNTESFQCWIGSLFFPKADRQTYLWLYGGGRNGKGSLCRVLAKIFGPGYSSEQVPTAAEQRFWSMGLLGKRLVAFPDCNHTAFTKSGLIKSVTGGDKIRVEFKGGGVTSEELTCMLLILSNNRPQISNQESDMRRAIFCEIGPITTDFGQNYEAELWGEAPFFVHKCIKLYKEKYPTFSAIRPDREANHLLASQADAYFEDMFQKHFRLDPDSSIPAEELRRICRDEKMDEFKSRYFCMWMENTHGVKYKLLRSKDNWKVRRYAYTGIRKKTTHDDILELDFSDEG